jgi:glycyl-tRNA synthetase beta chain
MNDLLIEIGCEDLPARYVQPLATALTEGFAGGLEKRGIARGQARSFATPRRIAAILSGVADKQADQIVGRKGPQLAAAFKDGQPTPAALGFAKSCGVEVSRLAQENGHLVFRSKQKGRKTVELIPEIFEETLKAMDELVPKRMRWGSGEETFVRPVRWLLALCGERVVPIQRFGQKGGRKTYGHRFHAPGAIALKSPAEYETALREAKVWADFASRRADIRRQVEAEAAKLGGTARITDDLLDEVTALVEWPVVISGRIEDRFLQLPPEVVVATVETNQRYFTVFTDKPGVQGQMRAEAGYLKPVFITVSNIESKDVAQVVAGNERVVRPRLTDALFFWEQDRKQAFAAFGARLAETTYQKDLGTVARKVERIGAMTGRIARALGLAEAQAAAATRAAALCKNDLVTRVVYEFPELQGLMGGYYARASGEPEMVARAIAEHYRPTQAGGPTPASIEGRIVALADKLDTLAGIFKIGQKPTASKDPFALRRAALGALRIVVEGGLDLDLRQLLGAAWDAQPVAATKDATLDEAWNFIVERLRGYCLDHGATIEQFEAVRSLGASRPLDFVNRLEALRAFTATAAAASLAAADKRARNILRQAGGTHGTNVAIHLFDSPAERVLLEQIERVEEKLAALRPSRSYAQMLAELSSLKQPVDDFFNAVMVMAEDAAVRANRLALLTRLDTLCRDVADLSCLPG